MSMLSTDALDALLHLSVSHLLSGLNIEYGVGFIEKYDSIRTKPIKWNKNISTGKWSPY